MQSEWKVAIQAVVAATKVIQLVFSRIDKSSVTKMDKSPVTIADFGSQIVINRILHSHFGDPIVGEEDSKALRADAELRQKVLELVNTVSHDNPFTEDDLLKYLDLGCDGGGMHRFWTLDPIDGTKGFLRGEQYAVCLALVEKGKVQFGVLSCPNLPLSLNDPQSPRGSLYYAIKGNGAFELPISDINAVPRRISVQPINSTEEANFLESVEAAHSSQSIASTIAAELGIKKEPVRMDSQCKYAAVARGDGSIYLRIPVSETYKENIWDHAAGCLIVEEAGGKVTDAHGNELDFSQGRNLTKNKGVIAAPQSIHARVIEVAKKYV